MVLACEPPVELVPTNSHPSLYIVLSREPWGSDSALYGLVVGGTEAGRLRYGVIDHIEMTRRRDGAKFGWQVINRTGPVAISSRSLDDAANVRLAWNGGATGLGRSALTPGDTYDLVVDVEGQQIGGSAALPSALSLQLVDSAGGVTAKWAPAISGTWFLLSISTDSPSQILTQDSSYRIKANLPREDWGPSPSFSVAAVDTAYLRFLIDTLKTSVGVSGGTGVFTGITRATKGIGVLPGRS